VCDVVLADARVLWKFNYSVRSYNTYIKEVAVEGSDPNIENKNGDNEWKFEEVFEDLFETQMGEDEDDLNFSEIAGRVRYPRNVNGFGIPMPDIITYLLSISYTFLAVDLQSSDTPPRAGHSYKLYKVGDAEQAEDITVITANENKLHKNHTTRINPVTGRSATTGMLAANSETVKLAVAGPIAGVGGTGVHLMPSPYANYDGLTATAEEVANEYKNSFGNTDQGWRDSTYAGFIAFKLNRAIHEITWKHTPRGVTTQIKSFRPRTDFKPKDSLHAYNGYWDTGGAGATQVLAKITQSLQREDLNADPMVLEVDHYHIDFLSGGEDFPEWAIDMEIEYDMIVQVTTPAVPPDTPATIAFYKSKQTATYTSTIETQPPNTSYWEDTQGEDAYVLGYSPFQSLVETIPWYQVNDIVEVVQRSLYKFELDPEELTNDIVGNSLRWYIVGTATRVEDNSSGERNYSLTWNVEQKRAMAVFK